MSKLISNYLFTVVYQLLLMLTPFITTPYVSRILKAEGIGIDAYVTSIVQLFLVFIILSIPLYGSRQIATKQTQEASSKEFWSIFTFQALVSLVNIFIYFIFVSNVNEYKDLFLINIFTILASSLDISWYFIGKEQMKKIAIRNMIVKIAGIILIFVLVKDFDDLPLYQLINGGTLFIGQLIMWVPLLKEVKIVKYTFKELKAHVQPILVLFLPQLLIQVYVLVNRIVLGNVSGEVEVGFYNQANKVIRIALGVISALGTVLLPRMASEFAKGNHNEINKYINYALQFVLLITLPMTFGMMAIAPNFVEWFLGRDFLEVSSILMIMSPVIFFVGLANVFGVQILISTNQQNKYSISITVGAILSLLINFMLVSPFGSTGTTIALVVAEGVGAIIQMYFARKYYNFGYFLKLFFKYLLISLILFIAASLFAMLVDISPIMITFIQLLIGFVVYFVGLLITRDTLVMKLLKTTQNKYMHKK
ncbi:flippase [Neobacillus niacini]|uniref:flippase n=1 Tax=Neobacillus niacini TaxID=86668 RepID=UPI00203A898F|nr:flippase [Neobacillus niacini]MCM3693179.1 flippase [Neobacillus niacini]